VEEGGGRGNKGLPFNRTLRDGRVFVQIQGDVLGVDASLHHTGLGVVSAAQEEARRFDGVVTDLFFPT
jgi:hypothetical protein